MNSAPETEKTHQGLGVVSETHGQGSDRRRTDAGETGQARVMALAVFSGDFNPRQGGGPTSAHPRVGPESQPHPSSPSFGENGIVLYTVSKAKGPTVQPWALCIGCDQDE